MYSPDAPGGRIAMISVSTTPGGGLPNPAGIGATTGGSGAGGGLEAGGGVGGAERAERCARVVGVRGGNHAQQDLARARCMTRGRGGSGTVAISQAPEDRASTPRWRVLTQIVLSRRGRRVSRFGKNHVKSTRGRRAHSRSSSGRAQPVGHAQRARRRLAGLVSGRGSWRAKCT